MLQPQKYTTLIENLSDTRYSKPCLNTVHCLSNHLRNSTCHEKYIFIDGSNTKKTINLAFSRLYPLEGNYDILQIVMVKLSQK